MHRFLIVAVATLLITPSAIQAKRPNFVIIFTDDQGYGDVSAI